MSNEQDAKKTENEPQPSDELTSEELDQVAGGGTPTGAATANGTTPTPPPVSDLQISKFVDKSSPILFNKAV